MALTYLVELACYLGSTSPTVHDISTGLKTWTLDAGSPIPTVGMTLKAEQTSNSSNWVEGTVRAVSKTSVTIMVGGTGGAGQGIANWTFTNGTLRFATRGYNHPSAPGFYSPVIAAGSAFRGSINIFGDGKTFGSASSNVGFIKVTNGGGVRDHLRKYAFNGYNARVLLGDENDAYEDFGEFIAGTVEQPVVSRDDVLFRFRDRMQELDKAIQATKYLGDNVLPNGLEGVESDLKGRNKPLLRGWAPNFTPVLVNTALLIYQLSAKAIHGIQSVKDGGVAVTAGTKATSLAQLTGNQKTFTVGTVPTNNLTCTAHGFSTGTSVFVYSSGTVPGGLVNGATYYVRAVDANTLSLHATAANATSNTSPMSVTTVGTGQHTLTYTPAAGTFDYYLGSATEGAFIRLGRAPTKGVTVTAWEGATEADRTIAQVWKRILIADAGYAVNEISAADVAAFDTAAPWETGIWTDTSETSVKTWLDKVTQSARGFYASDEAGTWRIGQIGVPTGTPVRTFKYFNASTVAKATEADIVALELVASNDDGRGLPACRINVEWGPNYTIQNVGDLNGDQTLANDPVGGIAVRESLKKEYQTYSYPSDGQDSSILKKWVVPIELSFTTQLNNQANVAILSSDLFNIYSQLRDRFKLTINLNKANIVAAKLGATIRVQAPRYGLDDGKLFTVLGFEPDPEAGTIVLDIWGAAA